MSCVRTTRAAAIVRLEDSQMNNAKFRALKTEQATTERSYKIDALWCAKEEAYREWRINDPAVMAKQAREQREQTTLRTVWGTDVLAPDSAWADELLSRAATLCPLRAAQLRKEYEEALAAFWNFVQGEKE